MAGPLSEAEVQVYEEQLLDMFVMLPTRLKYQLTPMRLIADWRELRKVARGVLDHHAMRCYGTPVETCANCQAARAALGIGPGGKTDDSA